jgi:hypothetical protein
VLDEPIRPRGFTLSDRIVLDRLTAENNARRAWGVTAFISEDHADFLAVWSPASPSSGDSMVTFARFRRTGTYAAIAYDSVIATAGTVEELVRSTGFDAG